MKEFYTVLIIGLLIGCIIGFFKTPIGKGIVGEFIVRLKIGKTKEGTKYVINNVTILSDDNKSSQIDHIVINKKGIFVIETKNYSGRIYGTDEQDNWTQVLNYGKVKNHFYNPVKQNKTHIYRLSKMFDKDAKFKSIIVFVKGNIDYITSEYISNVWRIKYKLSDGEEIYNKEQMEYYYNKIMDYKNNPQISSKEHVKEINDMLNDIENNICPRCGKNLVLRNSKNGNSFYGCSGYPNCKFTKKI